MLYSLLRGQRGSLPRRAGDPLALAGNAFGQDPCYICGGCAREPSCNSEDQDLLEIRGSSAPRLSALSPPPVSACPSRPAATRGIPTGTPHPVAGGRVWAEPRCGRQQARAQAQRLDGCRERARLRRRRLAGVACPTRPAGGGAATSARVGGSRQAQAGAAVAHH
jgi:hypothetical protein